MTGKRSRQAAGLSAIGARTACQTTAPAKSTRTAGQAAAADSSACGARQMIAPGVSPENTSPDSPKAPSGATQPRKRKKGGKA
jgi:hypothetical protein